MSRDIVPQRAQVLRISDLNVSMLQERMTRAILSGICLTVDEGEIVCVVGESGSGKSTLGYAVTGLLSREGMPQLSGDISVCGIDVFSAGPVRMRQLRRNIVRSIPQDPANSLNPTMRIGHQVTESTGCSWSTALEWLERLGLREPKCAMSSLPHSLSGGERQRTVIAMALMARPRLLIADEPTAALDASVGASVLDLIREQTGRNRAGVVMITHDLRLAERTADRIAVMQGGKIVEVGATPQIIDDPHHPYTRELLTARRIMMSGSWGDYYRSGDRITQASDNTATRPLRDPCYRLRADAKKGDTLVLREVGKSFQRTASWPWKATSRAILRSVSLSLNAGECLAIVGPSGSGKSTILNLAAGLLKPDAGSVWLSPDVKPQMVQQDPVASLTPWLTIGEQIGESLPQRTLASSVRMDQILEALAFVGLPASAINALPGQLSVGQCQRANIARAVLARTGLLLCDEPTSALDTSSTLTVLDLLNRIKIERGVAMLFVTHDMAAARLVSDRVMELVEGQLLPVTMESYGSNPNSLELCCSLAVVQ